MTSSRTPKPNSLFTSQFSQLARGAFCFFALLSLFAAPAGAVNDGRGNEVINNNVGVGIAVPTAKLAVDGSVYVLDGNVGIGTITPMARLQIDGAIYAGTIKPSNSSIDLSLPGNAMFGGNVEMDGALYVDSGIYFTGPLVGDGSRLSGIISSSSTIINDVDTAVYTVDGTNARVGFNINGSTSMIMDQNGNLGIGTTSPVAGLQVGSGSPSSTNTLTSADMLVAGKLEVDGSLYSWGNMGIGVARPTNKLSVSGNANITGNTDIDGNVAFGNNSSVGTNATINAARTLTSITNHEIGINGGVSANVSGDTVKSYRGLQFYTEVPTGNVRNFSGSLDGSFASAEHYGSGTVNQAIGGFNTVIASTPGGGKINVGFATFGDILNQGSGELTDGYAIYGSIENYGAGSIVNAYALYAASPRITAGSITNNYGLYIANQTGATTSNYAVYSAGGTNYFGGNTGIGTTAPAAKLQVDGAVYIGTTVPSHTTEVLMGTSGNAMFGKNVEIDGALYVDSGIYFTGPLVGDGSRLSGIVSGSSTIINDVDTAVYTIDGANARLGFNINGSTSMIIDQNGNVGIGSTSPTDKLGVSGTSAMIKVMDPAYSTNHLKLGVVNNGSGSYAGIWLNAVTPSVSNYSFLYSGYGVAFNAATAQDIRFRINNLDKMILSTGGNVGIATLVPAAALEVDGAIYANAGAMPSHTTEVLLGTAGNAMFGRNVEIDGAVYVDSSIYNTGSIQAGTTAPSHTQVALGTAGHGMFGGNVEIDGLLYVDGALYVEGTRVTGGSGTTIAGLTANNVSMANSAGNNLIDSAIYSVGSYVGIGSTSPSSALDVIGSAFPVIKGTRTSSGTNTSLSAIAVKQKTTSDMANGFGTSFSFIIEDSANVENVLGGMGAVRDGADNSGALTFDTRTLNVQSEKMRISTDGNLGIGTTAPRGKLEVDGSVYVMSGNIGIGTTTATAGLDVVSSVFPVMKGIRTSTGTSTSLSALEVKQRTTEDMVDGFGSAVSFAVEDSAGVENVLGSIGAVRDGADDSGALTFDTRTSGVQTEKMRISTSGNVGIGTISPGSTFDLKGSFAVYRVAKDADATTSGEVIIGVTSTAAARTITLANADKVAGRIIMVKDESGAAATNNITVQAEAGTIDGAANVVISANYGVVRVYSDGSNWFSF
ncbi:MAG: hypothetical protein HQL20_05600 [Candidatus Omnitrophica bacterium]|nr:hypothetical protein [Candidatus Omnitrophota bacterium]